MAMNARSVVSARRAGMSSPSADTDADTAHMMPNVRSVRRCRAQSPADHRVMSSLADDDRRIGRFRGVVVVAVVWVDVVREGCGVDGEREEHSREMHGRGR